MDNEQDLCEKCSAIFIHRFRCRECGEVFCDCCGMHSSLNHDSTNVRIDFFCPECEGVATRIVPRQARDDLH